MNLLVKPNSYRWNCYLFRVIRAVLASPNASIFPFSSSSSAPENIEETKRPNPPCKYKSFVPIIPLMRRISSKRDPSISISSILDHWIEEGGLTLKLSKLHNLTKKLRHWGCFDHALQVSEWMSRHRGDLLSAEHFAVRLDLILKVHGVEQAEEYFNIIPDTSKSYRVCILLLLGCAKAKQLDKAELLIKKMRDMGIILTAFVYNEILNFYGKEGKHEKIALLAEEMEEKGIIFNVTCEIRMHAYVASGDIEGMEKYLMKMNMDPTLGTSFRVYAFAAYGYLKAGLIDKAMTSLKKSEWLLCHYQIEYEKLLSLYAAMWNKAQVYRVWNLNTEYSNTKYISMVSSLFNLGDMDGAEKIWEEWWDSTDTEFDIRVPNLMISAFSRKGCWEKAEEYVNKIIKRGKEPNAASWDGLATGYLLGGRMLEAVETLKKAISTSKPGWSPTIHTLAACLKYLVRQGSSERP